MEERKLIWKIIGNGKSFFDKCKRDKINAYSAQSAFFIILSMTLRKTATGLC